MDYRKLRSLMLNFIFLLLTLPLFALHPHDSLKTADSLATLETKYLYANLQTFSNHKLLFGHQDDLAYGVRFKYFGARERSDIKIMCGEYPAVVGWDIGNAENNPYGSNLDGVSFSSMKIWTKDVYEMNCINTMSWHVSNPVTGLYSWDTTKAVSRILPGGDKHTKYLTWLDRIAEYLNSLKNTDGTLIPIIFRPFHEHTHSGFWWGQAHCTTEEFIQLWRFTVDYLRNTRDVHHLLYAYSPHDVWSYAEYIERYPGDDYVDIMGVDYYYWGTVNAGNIEEYKGRLVFNCQMAAEAARQHNKIAALTETGRENVDIPDWCTTCLLNPLKENDLLESISYALVWRNANTTHHFAPYKGHASEPDFLKFYQDSTTVFEKGMVNLYDELLIPVTKEPDEQLPANYQLISSYPNPFNNQTTIQIKLNYRSRVQLELYNICGVLITELIDENLAPGVYHHQWNADRISSGIYFIKFSTDRFTEYHKCVLIK